MKPLDTIELDALSADFSGQPIPAWQRGIRASDLMAKAFPPIRYVVQGYIAEGLTLFAGAPKIGKSWWALNVAYAVAAGTPVFGDIKAEQGDVLYLALEDNQRRLQSRLMAMRVASAPAALTLCTDWPTLAGGAVEEIQAWADSVEQPTLVIVDVLAKVRDATGNRESSYDADYRSLTGLQELAGEMGLAIVALHHTRKLDADDPFDSVSGTRGLTGAADTVLVLNRNSGDRRTVLYGRGRDVAEIEAAFEFDADSGIWNVLGNAFEVGRTQEREQILGIIRKATDPMTSQEVAEALGKNEEAVRRTLNRMVKDGELRKPKRGQFTCPKSPNVPNQDDCDNRTAGTGSAKQSGATDGAA